MACELKMARVRGKMLDEQLLERATLYRRKESKWASKYILCNILNVAKTMDSLTVTRRDEMDLELELDAHRPWRWSQ